MTLPRCAAPQPSFRLIPSRYPPVDAFDQVTTAEDAAAVMELEGWTNDRLVKSRLERLPRAEWVFGRANASVVMASFLHPPPTGSRFAGPELGAWYASAALTTAIFEVAHHLRRESVARGIPGTTRIFRSYTARLDGEYEEARAAGRAELYDPADYSAGQVFSENVRATGGNGIVYGSVRHVGGTNVVAYRPTLIVDVAQSEHFEIIVPVAGRLAARRLGMTAQP